MNITRELGSEDFYRVKAEVHLVHVVLAEVSYTEVPVSMHHPHRRLQLRQEQLE